MQERIQERGHCQHCGRLQAANPTIAKHGYTVDYGWFNGVCSGADYWPLEKSRIELDAQVKRLRYWADEADDKALKLEQREVDPEGHNERYHESGRRKTRLVPYAELSEAGKKQCRENAVYQLRRKARDFRGYANDLLALAEKVHGQPLVQVKINDQAKVIQVGDRVKVCGQEVVVTKLGYKEARGVGYRINGQHIEHVFWIGVDGKERGYPKRYARKLA